MANAARPLSIAIITNPPPRQWQMNLASALRSAGHSVTHVIDAARSVERDGGVELLLEFERLVYGAGSDAFAQDDRASSESNASSDLSIDLREQPASDTDEMRLIPLFDGAPGEAALISVLMDARAPELAIVRWGDEPHVLAEGLPALERRNVLALGLDQVLARTADLLRQCVSRFANGEQMERRAFSPALRTRSRSAAVFAAKGLATKLKQRLTDLVVHPEHWSIAFRRVQGESVMERGEWPNVEWTHVPDDGARYFADPFPFTDNGRNYVFCEEYPYATGKGIISLLEIINGRATNPRPIFERPYHLSYPFVFRRGSDVYMIPETSSVGRIELYRADPFPDRWIFERVLVEDVIASDATLVKCEGRDWLFASVAAEGASTWDSLGLFFADDLFGAWAAHPLNPVLIDAGAARPGGAMLVRGDRLRRIAQDCRALYGGGIVLADVERLDPEDYAQTLRAVLGPPPGSGADGAHTLNVAGDYEFIDLIGKKRRI
jgi:hypothetical protein